MSFVLLESGSKVRKSMHNTSSGRVGVMFTSGAAFSGGTLRRMQRLQCACFWFSVVTLISLLALCWMYICLVTFNDQEDVNWKSFKLLRLWVNWFMVVVIISAILTTYCILLLLFAMFQVALREPLNLHWLHKGLLCLGVLFITFGITGISLMWWKEWLTISLSLQATAPFLQMGGVGALTLLSPLVIQSYHRARRAGSKTLIIVVFAMVSAAIFLCPLLIHSPCLIEGSELPTKPDLIGHRGVPMLAPENTMMSFRRSVAACNVTAFETDVQLSKDRVPFLMHDTDSEFLMRTTDITEKFPGQKFPCSTSITWAELQILNAGDWFIKTDPFRSVSLLSAEERATARIQNISPLLELLELAKQYNISVIFDLKMATKGDNDTEDVVKTILKSGIAPGLVLWLPPEEREYVMQVAPGFVQVYDNITDMDEEGGHHLNVKYNALSAAEIRELRGRNVSVNLWVVNERWLFSLLWCSGASSVTTNSCHLLQDMTQPDWTMAPYKYRMIWITVDLVSLVVIFGLFIFQRKRCCFSDAPGKGMQRNKFSARNWRDSSPFLPAE
ncbi:glycerophosphoinositol inositolphosphodiesterase GDPD2 [Lampris incognitus]|uniref:glycerophosphoinositol inositolphosphodiesterase GDPD2 n=1 Tax=Lampris incognitus TaxID=2546036 RepID=UPI0024B520E8|nr:glycerophosphoinositol inositolphosphodiesterase GDPD2 [Lampris incognitus]